MFTGGRRRKQVVLQQAVEPEVLKPETNEQIVMSHIENRDYSAAATFIDFLHSELKQPYTKEIKLWEAYSLFHLGKYEEAIDVYNLILKDEPDDTIIYLYISSCQFYLQEFEEARESAEKGPNCDFKTRLLFHIAHQLSDDEALMENHRMLTGTLENQLSLAAIHYMRAHYQEAIEIYQKLLIENPDYIALNVYIAMCEFKLDMWEESNDAVDLYLTDNSDSAIALNLKSCDYLRLYEPSTAESQLLQIHKFSSATYGFVDSLINHNICVFHNGEDAFTVLPKLVGIVPEARYNLAIMYMREANSVEAYDLLQDYQPLEVNDTILKATVELAYGLVNTDSNLISDSNDKFEEVGGMDTVRDTVPGREALATHEFIEGKYDTCLEVLKTIEEHVGDTDEYHYDKGMSLAALSRWVEAEQELLLVTNHAYTKEIYYTSWLCKCYIMNRKPELAFNLYTECTSADDARVLLQIISTDCYTQKQYYYAMKAFEFLYKADLDPQVKEGMIASAVGVFRDVLTRKESNEKLGEVLECLAEEPDAEQVLQTIQNYIETSGEFDTGM